MRKIFKALEFIFIGIPLYLVVIVFYDAELRVFFPEDLEALEKRLKGEGK